MASALLCPGSLVLGEAGCRAVRPLKRPLERPCEEGIKPTAAASDMSSATGVSRLGSRPSRLG